MISWLRASIKAANEFERMTKELINGTGEKEPVGLLNSHEAEKRASEILKNMGSRTHYDGTEMIRVPFEAIEVTTMDDSAKGITTTIKNGKTFKFRRRGAFK